MSNLPVSDPNGLSDPYYIVNYGEQQFKSRIIYCNINPTYYDEFKFKIVNLEEKLKIKVFDKDKFTKDDLLGELEIDLTKEPFGKIVEKTYKLQEGSINIKWQITEPCQSRWN